MTRGERSEVAAAEPAAIEAIGVVKAFGAVLANRGASLTVAAGEIHAVVGENGAGKSTLMRMLAGLFPPDAGRVRVRGRDVTGWSTREAIAAGVGMVHQHFMLVPTLTVAENLILGDEITHGGRLDRAAANDAVRALSQRTGLTVEPTSLVSDLSVGEAQRVEILKVLHRGARILILDEPTAVLSPLEVGDLWRVLRKLRALGETVVLITHKLDEVMAISDVVTVMRAGETVGRMLTIEATPSGIARMMVGREVSLAGERLIEGADAVVAAPSAASVARPVALEVRELSVASRHGPNVVDRVTFDVRAGEVFAIAGVEGNGQTELIEALAGLRPIASGSVRLGATELGTLSVRRRADAGLSHIPEDRHHRGLILDYSVADNLVLGLQHRFSRRGVIDAPRVDENASRQISTFDIRPPVATLPARALSGGNQQKIVIAREMGRDFLVLLASQPTRGVDVGAIEFIHDQIRNARNAGKGVLLVSADLVEVLALADRIAVMYGGKLVVTLPRAEASAEILGPYMMGVSREGESGVPAGRTRGDAWRSERQ
jgi:general nucleoside transport system ATP-binding protein